MTNIIKSTYGELSDVQVASIATELAVVMNGYADHNNLTDMDVFYQLMQSRYDGHIAELRARSWTVDEIASRVLCPTW